MSDTEASEADQPPMLGMRSEPIPLSPEFRGVIAGVVVEWSRLEASIAMDTSSMMRYPIVQSLASEAPRSFTKKIALWKRSVDTLYADIPQYRAIASDVKPRALKASRIRNHLVHGTWDLSGPDESGAWTVSNMRALRVVESYDRMAVSLPLLEMLLGEIHSLSDSVSGFMVTKMVHAHLGLLKAVPAP